MVAVSDGRAALEALANDSFDVVLLEVQMPVMDGLEPVRKIRPREQSGERRTPCLRTACAAGKPAWTATFPNPTTPDPLPTGA